VPTPAQPNQRLILLEFNELCPHLAERFIEFIDDGALFNFRLLRHAHGIKDLDGADKAYQA
jgi:hypothetical protein